MAEHNKKVENKLQITKHPFYFKGLSSEEESKKLSEGYPFIITRAPKSEDFFLDYKTTRGNYKLRIRVTDTGFAIMHPKKREGFGHYQEIKSSNVQAQSVDDAFVMDTSYVTLDDLIKAKIPQDHLYFEIDKSGKLILDKKQEIESIIQSELHKIAHSSSLNKVIDEMYGTEKKYFEYLDYTIKKLVQHQDKFMDSKVFGVQDKEYYKKILENMMTAREASKAILTEIERGLLPLLEGQHSVEEFKKAAGTFSHVVSENIPKVANAIAFYPKAMKYVDKNERIKEFFKGIFETDFEKEQAALTNANVAFASRYATIFQRPLRIQLLFKDYQEKLTNLAVADVFKDSKNETKNIIQALEKLTVQKNPEIKSFNHIFEFKKFIEAKIRDRRETEAFKIHQEIGSYVDAVIGANIQLNQFKTADELKEYIEKYKPGIKIRKLDNSVTMAIYYHTLAQMVIKKAKEHGRELLSKDIPLRTDNKGNIIVQDNNGYDIIRISLQDMKGVNFKNQKKMKFFLINDDRRKMTSLKIDEAMNMMRDIITTLQETAFKKNKNPAEIGYKAIYNPKEECPVGLETVVSELKKKRQAMKEQRTEEIEALKSVKKQQSNRDEEIEKQKNEQKTASKEKQPPQERLEEKKVAARKLEENKETANKKTFTESKELKPKASQEVVSKATPKRDDLPAAAREQKKESSHLENIQQNLSTFKAFKEETFVVLKTYMERQEALGYVFFKGTSKEQWKSEIKEINEKHKALEALAKNIQTENQYNHFLQELGELRHITERLKATTWKGSYSGAFTFGRELMKISKKSKISADCKTFEGYSKLSEESLKNAEKHSVSTLYEGVAYKKFSDGSGKIEIIIPPITENMPPSGIVRTFNKDLKKAEIIMSSSSDKAILVALDTSSKFSPLTIEIPRDKTGKNPVSEDKIDEKDVDFVLKTFVASKIRGVPVKLDEHYREILKKRPEYALLQKIEQKEFKKEDIEGKTLENIVREIAGEKPQQKPRGSIFQNK